jgi:hypothetical protein
MCFTCVIQDSPVLRDASNYFANIAPSLWSVNTTSTDQLRDVATYQQVNPNIPSVMSGTVNTLLIGSVTMSYPATQHNISHSKMFFKCIQFLVLDLKYL